MNSDEIVFAGDMPDSTINNRVNAGELVRLARGVYTPSTASRPEDVVRRNLYQIISRVSPDSVITDRSAVTGGPAHGVLYLARSGVTRGRDIALPGVRVRVRRGAAAQPDDIRLPGNVWLASKARGIAENSIPSRSSRSGLARRLSKEELERWIDRIARNETTETLRSIRARAEELAPVVGAEGHIENAMAMVGAALGTNQDVSPQTAPLRIRQKRTPVDTGAVGRCEILAGALSQTSPQNRPLSSERGRYEYEPFFETYFSNFIEGTEFEVDEAARVVFEEEIPYARHEDAHDVIGTYRLISDPTDRSTVPRDADDFLEILQRRNATIMAARTDKRPGRFKEVNNRAGGTTFVDHTMVEGTLRVGFELRDDLDTGWEKAVYMMYVVSETHPFDDGNGRTGRLVMNAELSATGQDRIIIPTVFRTDYLDGLRMLSRSDDATILIKALRYAHDFTASTDFSDYEDAKHHLYVTNAFNEPESADRLILPRDGPQAGSRRPWLRSANEQGSEW